MAKIVTKERALDAVRINGLALENTWQHLRNDREVVLLAVSNNGLALEFASPELRNDREVVLQAIANNELALEFASPELKDDREVVLQVVANDGKALEYASTGLKKDKDVVLQAVANDGEALQYSYILLSKDVVMQAIANNGRALQYAHNAFKGDKEVVLQAVANNGLALQYASDMLKDDKDVVMQAVANHGEALAFASTRLKTDKEVVLQAVANNGKALRCASTELQNYKEVVLQAVANDGKALQYASDMLKDDKDVVAVAENGKLMAAALGNRIRLEKGAIIKTALAEDTIVLDIKGKNAVLFSKNQFVIANGISFNSKEGRFEWDYGKYAKDLSTISNMLNNNFEKMQETLSFLADYNHQDFIKGIISIETGVKNEDILDDMYDDYMNNDDARLIADELLNREAERDIDRHEAEFGADGKKVIPTDELDEQKDKSLAYITLHKVFCKQQEDKIHEGEIFNTMAMPKGTVLNGEDIGGYVINPKIMYENKFNTNEMVAQFDLDQLKGGEILLKNLRQATTKKVDINELKTAIDSQKQMYQETKKEADVEQHHKKKERDLGEEI